LSGSASASLRLCLRHLQIQERLETSLDVNYCLCCHHVSVLSTFRGLLADSASFVMYVQELCGHYVTLVDCSIAALATKSASAAKKRMATESLLVQFQWHEYIQGKRREGAKTSSSATFIQHGGARSGETYSTRTTNFVLNRGGDSSSSQTALHPSS